ncbi:MAG: hypothetical protein IPG71_13385 [bacterium]|nr:hypothetical protein [bacterium]
MAYRIANHSAMTCNHIGLTKPKRKQPGPELSPNVAGLTPVAAGVMTITVAARAELPAQHWLEAYWPAAVGLMAAAAIAAVCLYLIRSSRRNSPVNELAIWKTLADSTREVLILLDKSGNIVYMNRSFNGPESPAGMPVSLLFDEIDRPRWEKALSDVDSHALACSVATFQSPKGGPDRFLLGNPPFTCY